MEMCGSEQVEVVEGRSVMRGLGTGTDRAGGDKLSGVCCHRWPPDEGEHPSLSQVAWYVTLGWVTGDQGGRKGDWEDIPRESNLS